ncbi:MAG: UDP-N-acetylmuramoyl-L-alanyl-D-glutamate--2,6-diaminopimelate ligase [Clostridiales bacterium]|nr:UDP-N-acetylmuramoyl-L-alanyl-D-glutamate--2,6-diaminopimelate ligase [Clostridiales bacterium]
MYKTKKVGVGMRLKKLIDCVGENYVGCNQRDWDREITCLSIDSRQTENNALFFCLCGSCFDGHDYAATAVKNGAVAIVCQRELPIDVPQILVKNTRKALSFISSRFYGEANEHLSIVAVTGTNGKTTTAHVLAAILQSAGYKTGIIGTLGAKYAGKEVVCDLTTPDPIQLHKIFADMFLNGVQWVVMEVSAHALYYYKTEGIAFKACIFTNLSQDHLDFFLDLDAYKAAKKRLFFDSDNGVAILNGDDETGRKWGNERLQMKEFADKTFFYGLQEPADAFAVVTDESLSGSHCVFNVNDEICRAELSLTGKHNIYNALAAATCAITLGIDVVSVEKGLAALRGVRGRLERVANYRGADIFVDFAHTPDGLEKSLTALKKYCKGRLFCLFGCGGNRDKGKRALMGKIAAKNADFSVLTSDNPRYEDPLDILTEIEKGYRSVSKKYVIVSDRERAIEYALGCLHKGDVLLVAGKGGERYQEIMGIKYDFDDNDIIEKWIKKGNRSGSI